MNVLTTVILTILAIANIVLIFLIAWGLRFCKDKSSRVGGIIILSVLAVDMLAVG